MRVFVCVLWQLFTFADTYRGKYDSSIPLAKKYYQSASGYDVSQPFLIKRLDQDSRRTVGGCLVYIHICRNVIYTWDF